MSKKSRKKLKQWKKRAKIAKRGSIQTRRAAKNDKRWNTEVGYAVRQLNRQKYFKG